MLAARTGFVWWLFDSSQFFSFPILPSPLFGSYLEVLDPSATNAAPITVVDTLLNCAIQFDSKPTLRRSGHWFHNTEPRSGLQLAATIATVSLALTVVPGCRHVRKVSFIYWTAARSFCSPNRTPCKGGVFGTGFLAWWLWLLVRNNAQGLGCRGRSPIRSREVP